MTTFTHTIDGVAESSDQHFDVITPATAAAFAQCPSVSRDQLDRAVAAARSTSSRKCAKWTCPTSSSATTASIASS